MSEMNRPSEAERRMFTELRLSFQGMFVVLSTFRIAFPAALVYTRPWENAVCLSTQMTSPDGGGMSTEYVRIFLDKSSIALEWAPLTQRQVVVSSIKVPTVEE